MNENTEIETKPDRPWWAVEPPTVEELARAKRLRALYQSRARLSVEERLLAEATVREECARRQIPLLVAAYEQLEDDEKVLAVWERIQEQGLALAKALRDQGRLDEAENAWPYYEPELTRGREAIARPDEESCSCEDTVVVGASGLAPRHVLKKRIPVRTEEGIEWRYLIECSVCHHLNATRELPPLLAALTAARSNPDLAPEGVGPDSEILR